MNESQLRTILIEIENDKFIFGVEKNILLSTGEACLQFLRISGERFKDNSQVRDLCDFKLGTYITLFNILYQTYNDGSNVEDILDQKYRGNVRAILENIKTCESAEDKKMFEDMAIEIREQMTAFKKGWYVPTNIESKILNY